MDAEKINNALADISAEQDPTLKALKMASLCSTLFRERGIELVVVGGSAIEFLTEGAYTSGDLDLCYRMPVSITLRMRQELMGLLGARGGPRSWQVAGIFVDLLGEAESLARTPYRNINAPYGNVVVMKPEDLLVERVLVSVYPGPYPPARACARELAAVALKGAVNMDWPEVLRVAGLPEYRIVEECKTLVREVADELRLENPVDSN